MQKLSRRPRRGWTEAEVTGAPFETSINAYQHLEVSRFEHPTHPKEDYDLQPYKCLRFQCLTMCGTYDSGVTTWEYCHPSELVRFHLYFLYPATRWIHSVYEINDNNGWSNIRTFSTIWLSQVYMHLYFWEAEFFSKRGSSEARLERGGKNVNLLFLAPLNPTDFSGNRSLKLTRWRQANELEGNEKFMGGGWDVEVTTETNLPVPYQGSVYLRQS